MGAFSYTNIHIFDKRGHEIPLNYIGGIDVVIPNEYGDNAEFLAVANPDGGIDSMMPKSFGGRYRNLDDSGVVDCMVMTSDGRIHKEKVGVATQEYVSYPETYRYIKSVDPESLSKWTEVDVSNLAFPSATFITRVPFSRVSTELVETESLYMLVEEDDELKMPGTSEACREWSERYDIVFYIDCRKQEDFRLFTVNGDTVVWSDKQIVNLSRCNEVHIGFCGSNEGVYEQSMFICIYDKGATNDVYPVGEFRLEAEAVGEDERYRTLFTNFGIPDPKEYNDVFNDTEGYDDKMDNISLNEHSKKVFLSYTDIFPYVGSYKALINAVKMLGYDDIFFKEWYKDLGKTRKIDNGYVAFDMDYKSNSRANIISNMPIEERIQLRKMNWISMMYHINKELIEKGEDKWGFPTVIENDIYKSPEALAKLISLRKWLEKYIIGVHCRIIDVGGEGVFFERYILSTYSTYQQVIEHDKEKEVSPVVINPIAYIDGSGAVVTVRVNDDAKNPSIEDLGSMRFIDFCEGYLDEDNNYKVADASTEDGMAAYIGSTFAFGEKDTASYQLKLSGTCDGFMFNQDNGYISDGPSIIVDENRCYQLPSDLADAETFTTEFKKLPIVMLETASLRIADTSIFDAYSIERDMTRRTKTFVFTKHGEDGYSVPMSDVLTLMPGPDAEFGMSCENAFKSPQFYIKGYVSTISIDDPSLGIDGSTYFDLDILDGKFIFNDRDEGRRIILNVTGDGETKTTSTEVLATYTSEPFSLYEYVDGSGVVKRFSPGESYGDFLERYEEDPDAVIRYNPYIDICVSNAGEYVAEVICTDDQNTIFYASAIDTVKVKTKDVCLDVITNVESREPADADTVRSLYTQNEACLFDYVPKDIVIGNDPSSGGLGIYTKTYTNYCNAYSTRGWTQFSTLAYALEDVERCGDIQFSAKFRMADCGAVCVDTENAINMAREYVTIEDGAEDMQILEALDSSAIGIDTEFDINVILYDNITELPVMQLPARAIVDYDNATISAAFMSDIVDDDDFETFIERLTHERFSAHIQPTWMSRVILSEATGDTISCEYTNEYHFGSVVRDGDIMRLTVTNKEHESLVAGCAYTAAEQDAANKVRLLGSIDESYVGDDKDPVYYILPDDEQSKYRVIDEHLYDSNGPVLLNDVHVAATQFGEDGTIAAAVYYTNENGIPVRVYYKTDDEYKAKLRLSYAHLAYANYAALSTNSSHRDSMLNEIFMEASRSHINLSRHIDSTFTASTRPFNVNDAHLVWMTEDDMTNLIDSSIYVSHRPVVVDSPASVIAEVDAVAMFGPDASICDVHPRFKLYRRTRSNDANLIMDVYNSALFVHTYDPGIYDIEVSVYDRFGNRHTRMFAGAFTVK